jgi:hypothetical protein
MEPGLKEDPLDSPVRVGNIRRNVSTIRQRGDGAPGLLDGARGRVLKGKVKTRRDGSRREWKLQTKCLFAQLNLVLRRNTRLSACFFQGNVSRPLSPDLELS